LNNAVNIPSNSLILPLNTKTKPMKTIFNETDYSELIKRIESIQPTNARRWGKMDAAQMLAHCCFAMELALGEKTLKRSFLGRILGPMVKKSFLSDKPFNQNSPTAPEFLIVDQKDFDKEKARLLILAKKLHTAGEAGATKHPHGFFGHLTPQQWGETQYKHLDHHLRQFGA
jgi:hypothetical protein